MTILLAVLMTLFVLGPLCMGIGMLKGWERFAAISLVVAVVGGVGMIVYALVNVWMVALS